MGSSGKPAGCAKAIASLRVTGGGHLGTRTIGCTAYRINLSHAIKPGASGSVRIAFKVRVPRGDDRFGRVGQYTNIGNAVPILAVNDARGWHLDPYSSTGESFYSLSASWNVTLKMPNIYVTLEPCIMCTGAIIQARMRRLIFGCVDPKAGAVESLYRLCEDQRLNHQLPVVGGILAEASLVLLADFLQGATAKRENRKVERWPSPVEGA